MTNATMEAIKTVRAIAMVIIVMTLPRSLWQRSTASGCEFPLFMQTTASSRDWRRPIRAQNTEESGRVVVDHETLRSFPPPEEERKMPHLHKPLVPSSISLRYVEVCLKVITADGVERYLVLHQDNDDASKRSPPGNRSKYTCLQLIQRGPDIVQTRMSRLKDNPDDRLCDFSELGEPETWLLVDVAAMSARQSVPYPSLSYRRQSCGLSGGYRLQITGQRPDRKCDEAAAADIRLEADCSDDDGISFIFGRQECIPTGLYMYAVQRVVCMATWASGTFHYTVLRHDRLHYVWLLRYPANREDSFVAHLFLDLAAETEAVVQPVALHLRLELVRDPPLPVTSLCVDESESCAYGLARLACDDPKADPYRLTCSRTCGVCNATRPSLCEFPPEMIGQWFDGSDVMPNDYFMNLNISRQSVKVRSSIDSVSTVLFSEQFYCVRFELQSLQTTRNDLQMNNSWRSAETGRNLRTEEFLIATTPSDGCRRRFACIRVVMRSPNVLYFRFSQTRTWPLTSSVSDPIDCRHFSYDVDDRKRDLRTERFRLILSRERLRSLSAVESKPTSMSGTAPCRLPSDDLTNYSVSFGPTFDSSPDCTGSLSTMSRKSDDSEDLSTSRLFLTLSDCALVHRYVTFTCLDVVRLTVAGDQMVVTVVSPSPTSVTTPITPSFSPSEPTLPMVLLPSTLSQLFTSDSQRSKQFFTPSRQSTHSPQPTTPSSFVNVTVATASTISRTTARTSSMKSRKMTARPPVVASSTSSIPLQFPTSSSPLSGLFPVNMSLFQTGSVNCWLFPRSTYTLQFYVVSGARCTEIAVKGLRPADVRRQLTSPPTAAIFTKARGRSPRLEPSSLLQQSPVDDTSSLFSPASGVKAPSPGTPAVQQTQISLFSKPPEVRQTTDVIDAEGAGSLHRMDVELEDEATALSDDDVSVDERKFPVHSTPTALPDPQLTAENRQQSTFALIGAAFVLAILQLICICYTT